MQLKINIITLNSFFISFFIFQYSFCAPLSLYIGNEIPVVISTLLGGGIIGYYNWNKVSLHLYLFLAIFLVLLILQFLYNSNLSDGTLKIILFFISIGMIFSFIGSIPIDACLVERYCKKMAIINYVLLFVFFQKKLMLGLGGDLSMRFGYALLPSLIFFLYEIINNKSKWLGFLCILGLIQILIWGARGAILVLLLFGVLYIIYNHKLNRYCILFLLILFFCGEYIINILLFVIKNIPFETRKLYNYLTMLTVGLAESSSGRDVIYNEAIELFQSNIWGYGVGFYSEGDSGKYPHNLFLEIAVEWGIMGIFVICCLIVFFLYRLYKEKDILKKM